MANPIEAIFDRIALSIDAGVYTIEAGAKEAVRLVDDLFEGKPHGYAFDRVQKEVLAKIKRNKPLPPPPPYR